MEERSDAFKYCHVNKRPFPVCASGIGPWLPAFEVLSFVSIATNFALIALHPEARLFFSDYSDIQYALVFVGLEHLLVVLKLAIMVMVPDIPGVVMQQKMRLKFESAEALKKEVKLVAY